MSNEGQGKRNAVLDKRIDDDKDKVLIEKGETAMTKGNNDTIIDNAN